MPNFTLVPDSDSLAKRLQEIESWCVKNSVQRMYGRLEANTFLPEVSQKNENDETTSEYLNALENFAVSLLVIDVSRLTNADLQNKVDQLINMGGRADTIRLSDIEQCKEYIGYIKAIELAAFIDQPKLIFTHGFSADWFESNFGQEEFQQYESEYEESDSSNRIDELARRVANDPRFASASKQAEFQYIAKAVLREEKLSEREIKQIAREADVIFSMEVWPILAEQDKQKAKRLISEGRTVKEVANLLNMTLPKVRELLSSS